MFVSVDFFFWNSLPFYHCIVIDFFLDAQWYITDPGPNSMPDVLLYIPFACNQKRLYFHFLFPVLLYNLLYYSISLSFLDSVLNVPCLASRQFVWLDKTKMMILNLTSLENFVPKCLVIFLYSVSIGSNWWRLVFMYTVMGTKYSQISAHSLGSLVLAKFLLDLIFSWGQIVQHLFLIRYFYSKVPPVLNCFRMPNALHCLLFSLFWNSYRRYPIGSQILFYIKT